MNPNPNYPEEPPAKPSILVVGTTPNETVRKTCEAADRTRRVFVLLQFAAVLSLSLVVFPSPVPAIAAVVILQALAVYCRLRTVRMYRGAERLAIQLDRTPPR